MHTCTTTVIVAVLSSILVGCSSIEDSGSTGKAKSSGSANELTPQERASIQAEVGIPPAPGPAIRSAYIADLTEINPDIVHGRPDLAVSRGRGQCASIKDGESRERLLETTNDRFTSFDRPHGFGTAAAAKILNVVHQRLCPDY